MTLQQEATPRPWAWHPRFAVDDRNGSICSEQRPGHVYAVAMQPRYVTNEQWASDAELIVRAVNAHDALVAAVEKVRGIISDAALTGFNWKDGDWADRLFASQCATSTALHHAKHGAGVSNEEAGQ